MPLAALRLKLGVLLLLTAAGLSAAVSPWAVAAVGLTCLGIPVAVALRYGPAAARDLLWLPPCLPVPYEPDDRRS
ncbi:hypothetical protein ONA70_12440 [Micromonospora yasonensis]|uniref:hypothetical protein n=1 Tax=Micromonospora yasonensis TaxID=1128667 RepID=UPI00222F3465|nr:hypothetical protein [Micromonospora yasonensis]MCW3840907.1 hypothetical protein [Micromonospora yasonensis]